MITAKGWKGVRESETLVLPLRGGKRRGREGEEEEEEKEGEEAEAEKGPAPLASPSSSSSSNPGQSPLGKSILPIAVAAHAIAQ